MCKGDRGRRGEPNSTYYVTIAGLQGLHLDLGDGSKLPSLSDLEVRRAIGYPKGDLKNG